MKTITSYEDLQCWKLSVELCDLVYTLCEKAGMPTDSELACRRYVAALNVSGKIAFSYGPEETEWLKQWMPVARKYAVETVFRAGIAMTKGTLKKSDYKKVERLVKRIIRKIDSITKYLDKYGSDEKYKWNVFFKKIT